MLKEMKPSDSERYIRELEARNDELSAYAHMVAHNLKHPLTHMMLVASTLSHAGATDLPSEYHVHLRTIEEYAQKMSDTVNELLLLSEVRDRDELVLSRVDMGAILRRAQNRLIALVRQTGAEIQFPQQWPMILSYAPWVEEVWVNYLENALRYGGKPPRIQLGSEVEAANKVRFWIRDHGPGVPADLSDALFKPYVRLHPNVAAPLPSDGSGLGLSIVRRIVEKLGGEVGFHNHSEGGAVFSFTMPGMLSDSL